MHTFHELGKPQKEVIFFSGLTPLPLELSFGGAFLELQKKLFFLSAPRSLPPPTLLVAGPLKKGLFSASLTLSEKFLISSVLRWKQLQS